MRYLSNIFIALILFSSANAGDISVEVIVIARGVENRIPIGVNDSFPSNVGRVYCYSKIVRGKEGNVVRHVWYYNNKPISEVSFNVTSSSYRFYSYKTIPPYAKGKWRVDLTMQDGTVLKSIDFTIE